MDKLFGKLVQRLKGAELALIAAISVVVFLLACRFIFATAEGSLKELKKKIAAEEAQLARLASLQSRKEEIIREYARVRNYTLEAGSTQESMTRVLKEIERITQEVGVTVVSLLPSNDFSQDAQCKKYRFDLQIEGDTKQILWFLSTVQESKYLLMVESFALSSKTEGSPILHLAASISFLQYPASSPAAQGSR